MAHATNGVTDDAAMLSVLDLQRQQIYGVCLNLLPHAADGYTVCSKHGQDSCRTWQRTKPSHQYVHI